MIFNAIQVFTCVMGTITVVKTGTIDVLFTVNNTECSEVSKTELSGILGASLNSRYMSITPPRDENPQKESRKRKVEEYPPFYVEEGFSQELSNEPAWSINNHLLHRRKRGTKISHQWECNSKLNWIDLGPDYFPQYLRSVECLSKSCWYGHFKCKPRSFTLKLLRRKRNRCVLAKTGNKIGVEGLPVELKELWVWEERAVNFCCDCGI